jgi:hypothetical protein
MACLNDTKKYMFKILEIIQIASDVVVTWKSIGIFDSGVGG